MVCCRSSSLQQQARKRRQGQTHEGADGCLVIVVFFAKEKKGCTEYQHLLVLNTKGVLWLLRPPGRSLTDSSITFLTEKNTSTFRSGCVFYYKYTGNQCTADIRKQYNKGWSTLPTLKWTEKKVINVQYSETAKTGVVTNLHIRKLQNWKLTYIFGNCKLVWWPTYIFGNCKTGN